MKHPWNKQIAYLATKSTLKELNHVVSMNPVQSTYVFNKQCVSNVQTW